MEVAAWLDALGLGQYARAFAENGVDAAVLPRLTPEDLRELGVTAVGHRRKLVDAIAALGAESGRLPAPPIEADGERRQVTVLFADLAGYTAMSRQLDAEEVHALLQRFFARIDRIVEEHGGRADKHLGDCVMAVFGAPLAHGNDAERAVRAALAVRDAMPALAAELGCAVGVHVGVAGGQVVASGTGSARHREYTVTGDSVNLASRLTDAAAPGEVLLSEAVRRELIERLDCAERDALVVKGFAEPVRAWRLEGLRESARRDRPLVGRRGELRQFRAVLDACREEGRGRAVHVRGEAGIGKTRLVEAFQDAAREAGFACHGGLVLDFGAGAGRDAIGTLVRGVLGPEAAPAEGLATPEDAVFPNDLLGLPQPTDLRALYDAMDNATRDLGKRGAVARLVERASRTRPRLLVLEDLHWADRPTLAHAAALAGVAARCPAILVTTSRVEGDPLDQAWRAETGGGPLLSIDLGPLHEADARALAAPFLASNAAATAERCVERAAGNPLFLEQLLRHAETGAGAGAEAGVPGSVQSLVQARLDRLDPADKGVLQAASALGQRFDRDALDHLLRGASGSSPERLAERSLVRPQGAGFLFAHALIRDAVYDGLLRSPRRELHRRAADWFAGRDPALRAEHLDRAGDPGAARAHLDAARAQAAGYRHEAALRSVERGGWSWPPTGPTAPPSAAPAATSCTTWGRCRTPAARTRRPSRRPRTTPSGAGRGSGSRP